MHNGDIFGISIHCSDKMVTSNCHSISATPIPDPKIPEKNEIVHLCCATINSFHLHLVYFIFILYFYVLHYILTHLTFYLPL
jgi:hypothetical protein